MHHPQLTQDMLLIPNGVHADATELLLYQLFAKYGPILGCRVRMDRETGRCKCATAVHGGGVLLRLCKRSGACMQHHDQGRSVVVHPWC